MCTPGFKGTDCEGMHFFLLMQDFTRRCCHAHKYVINLFRQPFSLSLNRADNFVVQLNKVGTKSYYKFVASVSLSLS